MVAGDGVGGGGEGEEIVDGGGELGGALVAVALHAVDPFGIDDAGADDAGDLFLQGADHRAFGAGMVVMVDDRGLAAQGLDRRGGAAFERVVIVAVEEVVLAVVLVLDDGVGLAQPGFERGAGVGAVGAVAVGVGAPGEVGVGEVGAVCPGAFGEGRRPAP